MAKAMKKEKHGKMSGRTPHEEPHEKTGGKGMMEQKSRGKKGGKSKKMSGKSY